MSHENKEVVDIRSLSENLQFFKEDIEDLAVKTKSDINGIPERIDLTKADIFSLFAKIKQHIGKQEQFLLSQVNGMFTDSGGKLDKRLAEMREVANQLFELKNKVDQLRVADKPDNARASTLQGEYDMLLTKFMQLKDSQCCPVVTEVKTDTAVMETMSFGRFEMKSEFSSEYESTADAEEIDIFQPLSFSTHKSNENDCILTSIVWKNKRFVVTDKSNKKVKFFKDDGTFIHELLFPNFEPYGICFAMTNDCLDLFAVTFPKNNMIYIVGIASTFKEDPKIVSYFYTHVGYAGVSPGVRNGSLIASVVNNDGYERVDIIGYTGEIFKTFRTDAIGQPLFVHPRYVMVKGTLIIVSDFRMNCVMFLDEEKGEIVGRYKGTKEHPLTHPYDLTIDSNGHVYVMDGKTGHIHIIDEEYQQLNLITETSSLLNPRLIAHDERSGRLAVTHGAGEVKTMYHYTSEPKPDIPTINQPLSLPEGMLFPPEHNLNIRSPSPGF